MTYSTYNVISLCLITKLISSTRALKMNELNDNKYIRIAVQYIHCAFQKEDCQKKKNNNKG